MRFSKFLFLILSVALLATLTPTKVSAHGDLGMTAAIGLPNGVTPAVGLPSNAFNRITISTAASSSFNIRLSDMFQLDLGLGYMSVSQGEGTDAQNTLSFGAGGKYFLKRGDVQPYVNLGFSFTQIPTIENGTSKVSGNMITVLGAFGVQSFINQANTVALFVQMGFGYNMGSVETANTIAGQTTTSTSDFSTMNLGGSAIGMSIYF
ncbi:MAG: hypothetical protein CVV25_07355 [Ignavibacteriae bacterium HGW-Ignavibacteriae-4]|nr:MAG: hypothetical protein CVV25_07355 [Ignavibacteriae bacterium HGW-Ignavibacteriae-4]